MSLLTPSASTPKKMSGGFGAADYGVATYGAPNAQHAAPNGAIATNAGAYGNPMTGGRRRRKSCRGGSRRRRRRNNGGTAELAVPVGLMAANYYLGRRRSSRSSINMNPFASSSRRGRSYRHRRSNRRSRSFRRRYRGGGMKIKPDLLKMTISELTEEYMRIYKSQHPQDKYPKMYTEDITVDKGTSYKSAHPNEPPEYTSKIGLFENKVRNTLELMSNGLGENERNNTLNNVKNCVSGTLDKNNCPVFEFETIEDIENVLMNRFKGVNDKSLYIHPKNMNLAFYFGEKTAPAPAPASDEKPLSTGDPRLLVNHENAPPTRASTYIPVAPGKTTEDEKPYNPLFW